MRFLVGGDPPVDTFVSHTADAGARDICSKSGAPAHSSATSGTGRMPVNMHLANGALAAHLRHTRVYRCSVMTPLVVRADTFRVSPLSPC